MFIKSILTTILLAVACCSYAQHDHHTKKTEDPLQFASVLSQKLSDPELKNYTVESTVLTIIPRGIDTVSHRHDCELFGYILSGEVDIALTNKVPKTYRTGEMFYEKRNVLHTITRNPQVDKPTKILLISIIKDGRPGYTPEYQK